MTSEPHGRPRPEPGGSREALLRRAAWLLLGGGTVVAGAWGGEQLLRRLVVSQSQRLEKQLSRLLGHPLQLGPFQGIGPTGLRLGPSRIGPGPADRSQASVAGVDVALAPLASLRQGLPVLRIGLRQAQLRLERNARGQVWVLGPTVAGQSPPRLELQFRLIGAGRVTLAPAPDRPPVGGSLQGQLTLKPHRFALLARGRLDPSGGGQLPFLLSGQWQQRQWSLRVQPQRLALSPLLPLLPWRLPPAWRLEGSLDGALNLHWRRGAPLACRGQVTAASLAWWPLASQPPVRAPRLPLRCQGERFSTDGARLVWGSWQGTLQGWLDPAQRWDLRLQARQHSGGSALGGRWHGPWRTPMLDLQGRLALPAGAGRPASLRPLRVSSRLRLFPGLAIEALQADSEGSSLQLAGSLLPAPRLRGQLAWQPAALPVALRPWIGVAALPVSLQIAGSWGDPAVALQVPRQPHPLLESWQASLRWRAGRLDLLSLDTPHLWASGAIPLVGSGGGGGGVGGGGGAPDRDGALATLRLDLNRFPLHRVGALLGTDLHGWLSARGSLRGASVASWSPDLSLTVERPGAGPVQLAETWSGTLRGGKGGGGSAPSPAGRLLLEALAPARPGRLVAQLDRRWLPRWAELERAQGRLQLHGDVRAYRWQARQLPLEGLELTLGPRRRQQPLQGRLDGEGSLGFQPFALAGHSRVEAPVLLGVRGRRLELAGRWADQRYRLDGQLLAADAARVGIAATGVWRGVQWTRLEARGLTMPWLEQLLQAWPRWRGDPQPPPGSARDLGSLAIDTVGASLQEQLEALERARQALALRVEAGGVGSDSSERRLRLGELGGLVDADLTVRGEPGVSPWLDLAAKGHLWRAEGGRDRPVGLEPFVARLQGRLIGGAGAFAIDRLPLDLLALFTPLPATLQGAGSLRGRYRLGGRSPSLEAELTLVQGRLGERPLRLERGRLTLVDDLWSVDAALRAEGALSDVDLRGQIPVDPARKALELRLASRGDGLQFLTALAGPALSWRRGSADLQLLVRGSLRQPIANGFLRCSEGELEFIGQRLRNFEATVLFDFDALRLQSLTASVGPAGRISGQGAIALVRERPEPTPLSLRLHQVPFSFPRISGRSDGTLTLTGSLLAPVLSGDLRLSRGRINAQPGQLSTERRPPTGAAPAVVTVPELVENRWDFSAPLALLGPDVESRTAASLREAVPRVSFLQLRGLVLSLGPDLRVVLPNVASFTTGGSVRLSGRLDPTLRASGVVRLLGGRLSLFTTSFSLDPKAPNVAVFTPSLGLVPFVDVALRTRVSDSVGRRPGRDAITDLDLSGSTSALDQLRLVKVELQATGPADRLIDNIRLSSVPPLPQERLVALIGGNSLAGLSDGNAGAALATVLGQSLLSPLVSSLTDAFGQRFSFALYPTYVPPLVSPGTARSLSGSGRSDNSSDNGSNSSRRLPSTLVLGSEIGLDITERFNASVLAAPNRSDIPPQLVLRYQLSDKIGVQGSVDQLGRLQTQLQVFFRF